MTIDDWVTEARAELDPTVYTEPVMDWTVHVDGGHLAFVRADATLFVGEKAERHNIDYFTLIKTNGVWKFVTLSNVGTPVESKWASIPPAHNGCEFRWSLQRFGEFVGWCHPSEGLSRPGVERVGGLVEVFLGEFGHVGAFGKVLA